MSNPSVQTLVRSGSAPFRARARLIRLLGEELISDEIMALVELVKNTYDADAQRVQVRFLHLGDPEAACIEIRDDGQGMDLDAVLHRWLEPATDHKHGGARKKRTRLGRFPLGEKGVGRFAADKIGSDLELVTRPPGEADEIALHVSWHRFDDGGYLDQIENHWQIRAPVTFQGDEHGTALRMSHLRAAWTEDFLARVRDGLAQLTSPHAVLDDFAIDLDCPEFPALAGVVTSDLLAHAAYHVAGRVDDWGTFTPEDPADGPPLDMRMAAHEHFLSPDGSIRVPVCGPFRVALYAWDLDVGGLRRAGIDRALRDILRKSCGVRIYRDGFRVWPYGDQDDDWLELNQRRVNNPTLRLSNNQIVGYIEITQADNPDLRDRTSREGMIDTPAFFDLKALGLGVLAELEDRRFAARREDEPAPAPGDVESDEVLRQMQAARTRIRGETGWRTALQAIEQTYRQQARDQQVRYQYVAGLAGLGLAAERMTHAFADVVRDAVRDMRILRNGVEVDSLREVDLGDRLAAIAERFDALEELLDLMGPLYRSGASASEPLDVAAVAQDALGLFAAPLQALGARATVTQIRSVTMHMSRAHLMQVFICLIDNAVRSLREQTPGQGTGVGPEVRLHVFTRPRGASRPAEAGVIIADNGPGVKPTVRNLIFQPHYSSRRDGVGLGLYVARDLLGHYNSTVDLLDKPKVLPGANFRIVFDGRRVGRRPRLWEESAAAEGAHEDA